MPGPRAASSQERWPAPSFPLKDEPELGTGKRRDMTTFELLYACTLPLEHPLHQYVHRTIKGIAPADGERPRHLDVGGRRSTYTCNVPAEVWITDVPRE